MKLNINDHVYYALNGICEVKDIQKLKIGNEEKEYYVLTPINSSTTLFVPTDNLDTLSKIKKILRKEEIDNLIKESKNINLEWLKNSKDRNVYFQNLIKKDDLKTSIALINLIYTKQKEDTKVSPNDLLILSNVQNLIHSSLSYSLNITKDEVKDYILNILEEDYVVH